MDIERRTPRSGPYFVGGWGGTGVGGNVYCSPFHVRAGTFAFLPPRVVFRFFVCQSCVHWLDVGSSGLATSRFV